MAARSLQYIILGINTDGIDPVDATFKANGKALLNASVQLAGEVHSIRDPEGMPGNFPVNLYDSH